MRLAVCAEMVFLDLPVTERVRRIAEAGFDAEIWDWTRHDIGAIGVAGDETADWPLPRLRIRSFNRSAPHGTSADASTASLAISLSSSRTFPGKL